MGEKTREGERGWAGGEGNLDWKRAEQAEPRKVGSPLLGERYPHGPLSAMSCTRELHLQATRVHWMAGVEASSPQCRPCPRPSLSAWAVLVRQPSAVLAKRCMKITEELPRSFP